MTWIDARLISAGSLVLLMSAAYGQDYPNRPIRMVTTAPGGGNDFAARLISSGMSAGIGQPVIVDNRSSTVVPGDIVAKSPPDGYTILLASSSFTIGPLLVKNAPYDPVKDFAPITLAVGLAQYSGGASVGAGKFNHGVIALPKLNRASSTMPRPEYGSAAHLAASCSKPWPESISCT